MKVKINSPTEHQEQVAIFDWAAYSTGKYPELAALNCSLSGVKLTIGQAVKAKRAGMKKGFPDISMPVRSRGFGGMFIELKKVNGVPSDVKAHQREWLNFLITQGYFCAAAFGSEEAIFLIKWYLDGKNITSQQS